MSAIGLSASFPHGERGEAVRPFSPPDIGLAVASVVEGVLRSGGQIIFGGHPTISPIVLHVAHILRAGKQVKIYQSEHFADSITPEVRLLADREGAKIVFTDLGTDLADSLTIMREQMLGETLAGIFYVGGMEGIEDELTLSELRRPTSMNFLMATPGGMAGRLSNASDEFPASAAEVEKLSSQRWRLAGRGYSSLVLRALELLGQPALPDDENEL